ncbi:Signal transduction histidine kinase [Reichenbachiella agariperforans]|uniref:histidine kinase n=1 Tax=Reichenbachiella agariperforans TaxID=156994 RepID=A0A1M6L287_REIAG|nr:ATP-binding protein [Reichenbachiella agariperforans]SHJ65273.1 Signal transduction histidine kinase [Reichenbachiella agariperforans]
MIKSPNIIWLTAFLIAYSFLSSGSDLSWETFQKNEQGEITIYYRNTDPFLIVHENGTLRGLEYEMLVGFKYYLQNKYGYNLKLNWKKKNNFREIYAYIRDSSQIGDLGLDIISKIPEREKEVKFSVPYFPDIQVFITNRKAPTLTSRKDFSTLFSEYQGIAVPATTYDIYLRELRDKHNVDFNITHINSSNDIIQTIATNANTFGYVDLPSYILALNKNQNIKRQNLLSKKGFGYCLIFNINSDWHTPFNEYLASEEFEILKTKGIRKYLGDDVNQLIHSIAEGENEDVVLLQEEKKFINHELDEKEKQAAEQNHVQNILLISIVLVLTIAYFLYNSNRVKSKANEILTKHRQMIEQQNILLSRRNEELVSRDEEKNNFIHILSHDLRAPINNITGLSQILTMSKEDLNADQLRMIEHIATESSRLNKMVTRILDIEKIESKTSEQFERINLSQILLHVIGNYQTQALSKKIEIVTDLANEIAVLGDEQYLFHVFENLLSNAIKFSPHGKKVYVNLVAQNHLAIANISDEGPGMTASDQQNMFKKFQVLTAKATAGERSTGLGLSIVDKYIGLLGGELSCDSEPNKGTTFTVKLSLV